MESADKVSTTNTAEAPGVEASADTWVAFSDETEEPIEEGQDVFYDEPALSVPVA